MDINLEEQFNKLGFEKKSGDFFLKDLHILMTPFECYLLIKSKKTPFKILSKFNYKYISSGFFYINDKEKISYIIFIRKIKNYIRLYKINKINGAI